MIFIFYPVCLKCYSVRPQTRIHPGFKRDLFSHLGRRLSIQNLAVLRNVTDMVCGGKTYTVTQIQTYDSDIFYDYVTAVQGSSEEDILCKIFSGSCLFF